MRARRIIGSVTKLETCKTFEFFSDICSNLFVQNFVFSKFLFFQNFCFFKIFFFQNFCFFKIFVFQKFCFFSFFIFLNWLFAQFSFLKLVDG